MAVVAVEAGWDLGLLAFELLEPILGVRSAIAAVNTATAVSIAAAMDYLTSSGHPEEAQRMGDQMAPHRVKKIPFSPNLSAHYSKYMPKNTKQQAKKKPQRSPEVKDRNVSAPSAMGKVITVPKMRVRGGRVIVTHREYLGDITGTGSVNTLFALKMNQFIDPAGPETFPWLSTIACSFEQFRLLKLKLEYVPESSTGTSGAVMIAIDRNSARTAPSTKVSLLEIEGALRTPTWQGASVVIQNDNSTHYINPYQEYPPSFSSRAQADPRVSTAGAFYVGTSATTAGVLGEIWIDYTIELMEPTQVLPAYNSSRILSNNASGGHLFTSYPNFQDASVNLYGTMLIYLTSQDAFAFNYTGPTVLWAVLPTSSASAAATFVITFSPSGGGTATIIESTINAGSTAVAYYITGANASSLVTVTNTSVTNMNASAAIPAKIYLFPMDLSAAGTPVL